MYRYFFKSITTFKKKTELILDKIWCKSLLFSFVAVIIVIIVSLLEGFDLPASVQRDKRELDIGVTMVGLANHVFDTGRSATETHTPPPWSSLAFH